MQLKLATRWEEIEAVTDIVQTCIGPRGMNYLKAKQDWEQHPSIVEYWLVEDPYGHLGYIRLVRVTKSMYTVPTWLLDFVSSRNSIGVLLLELQQVLGGSLLVKLDLVAQAGKQQFFTAQFVLPNIGHTFCRGERCWVVLPCYNQVKLAGMRQPAEKETAIPAEFDD